MNCFALTKEGKLCRGPCGFLLCARHWIGLLVFVFVAIAWVAEVIPLLERLFPAKPVPPEVVHGTISIEPQNVYIPLLAVGEFENGENTRINFQFKPKVVQKDNGEFDLVLIVTGSITGQASGAVRKAEDSGTSVVVKDLGIFHTVTIPKEIAQFSFGKSDQKHGNQMLYLPDKPDRLPVNPLINSLLINNQTPNLDVGLGPLDIPVERLAPSQPEAGWPEWLVLLVSLVPILLLILVFTILICRRKRCASTEMAPS